jgi:lycopene cyclase domain-containing protein
MTYLTFLLILLIIPIVGLAALPRPSLGVERWRSLASIPLVCVIAFVYTTPWDNYLVYREVWWYGLDRVLGTIGYVPYEEYAFFVLQPIMTGLLTYHVYSRRRFAERLPVSSGGISFVALFYAAVSLLGAWFLIFGPLQSLYMGLILAWAGPVLLGLWIAGRRLYASDPVAFWASFAPATMYLWAADIFAMAQGIWTISDVTSFDIDPLGLPIEEATFFLVTNLLVVQGVVLFAFGYKLPNPFSRSESTQARAAV